MEGGSIVESSSMSLSSLGQLGEDTQRPGGCGLSDDCKSLASE